MLTKRKRYKNQTLRRARTSGSPGARSNSVVASNIVPTSFVHAANNLTVTFPAPVIYSGVLPGYLNNAQHVTAVSVTSPTVFVLTFSGATAAGNVTVPFQDPAFRSMSAGYVQSGTYTAT